jgi:hypothetical protein
MYTVIVLSDTFGNKIYNDVKSIEIDGTVTKLILSKGKFPFILLSSDSISSVHAINSGDLTE